MGRAERKALKAYRKSFPKGTVFPHLGVEVSNGQILHWLPLVGRVCVMGPLAGASVTVPVPVITSHHRVAGGGTATLLTGTPVVGAVTALTKKQEVHTQGIITLANGDVWPTIRLDSWQAVTSAQREAAQFNALANSHKE